MRKYHDVCNNMDKNSGKYICFQCSMFKHRGRNHHRCKYKKLDDHFMDIIDSEEKAYLLGPLSKPRPSRGSEGKDRRMDCI